MPGTSQLQFKIIFISRSVLLYIQNFLLLWYNGLNQTFNIFLTPFSVCMHPIGISSSSIALEYLVLKVVT